MLLMLLMLEREQSSLIWSDEFTSFDVNKWTKAPANWTDLYGSTAAWDPALVTQSGSTIRLACQKVGSVWNGSLINTLGKAQWTYGYFECRCKVPKGVGMWSAFWMMPAQPAYGGWPLSGEVDILEYIGTPQEEGAGYSTLHYDSVSPSVSAQTGGDLSQDFHVWGCLHTPGEFKFYLDNVLYGTLNVGQPFDQPFFFLLNLAVGGAWAGEPEDISSGKYLEVDYVRVYAPAA